MKHELKTPLKHRNFTVMTYSCVHFGFQLKNDRNTSVRDTAGKTEGPSAECEVEELLQLDLDFYRNISLIYSVLAACAGLLLSNVLELLNILTCVFSFVHLLSHVSGALAVLLCVLTKRRPPV